MCYSLLIYYVYFDDNYIDNNSIINTINNNDKVINDVLIDELMVKYKSNMECTQQKNKLSI
jgi:hypothetical protein